MSATILRFCDYEREPRPRLVPRDDAIIIILPVVRIERYAEPEPRARKRKQVQATIPYFP